MSVNEWVVDNAEFYNCREEFFQDGIGHLGCKRATVVDSLAKMKRKGRVSHDCLPNIDSPTKKVSSNVVNESTKNPKMGAAWGQKKGMANASLTDTRIRTLDDLVDACSIDLEVWECISFDVKCWEMGRKAKESDMTFNDGVSNGYSRDSGKIFVQPLYSVLAKFKKRREFGLKKLAAFFRNELSNLPEPSWSYEPLPAGDNVLELMMPDLHVGQQSWGLETNAGNYNVNIALDLLKKSVNHLISEAGDRVSKIAFPIGNDFFNVDNLNNTTTKGTPQDEDCRWQKSFRVGCNALIDIISELSVKYEVDVIVIPGNHDEQRSFYMGEVVAAVFRNNERVSVDNSPTNRKYRLYGATLVGYSHGDQESPKDLPMLMAHQVPELWAKSTKREWHHGHLHHEKNNEIGAVKLRHFPALVAPSAWAAKKGYVMSTRMACAMEYSDKGLSRQYNWYVE
jgi:hypothetical protein